ncbi:hypothetical protein [Puia dinghuensis]|uniref:Uncharacterized protein n=1 Tax=Puia dinghuensis TaxID=1792502 RepID=A0A8J2XRU3_9BACT|nr:hypothetical protein [Puia dinghuensis]GGB04283.1 hypothetical protein GCM10011511_29510 [Puia dinghuensis]
MERLKELLTQLKEQFDHKAEPARMLETAKSIEAELELLASQPAPAKVMPTKIAVMMPSATKIYAGQPPAQPAPEPKKDLAAQRNNAPAGVVNGVNGAHSEAKMEVPAAAPVTPVPVEPLDTADVRHDTADGHYDSADNQHDSANARYMPPAQAAPVPPDHAIETVTLEKPLDRGVWPFNPLADKPIDRFTLSQRSKEVNDVIGMSGTSLNDKLKSDVADLKTTLNGAPVRDLRKAIGVNDRYVFINQLFRGDEVMYERSLKTINGFRILPEAEYWMERELKVKLGWDENREATRHFYQLVKRRFS